MANIQDVRAVNTPQKSYMWEVSITGLSTGSNSDLTFHAKTVAIPASQVDTSVINFKAGHVYHAGRDASGHNLSITFWDDESQTVRSFFQNWFDLLMFNPVTGSQAPKNLYTADVTIRLLDSTGAVSTAQILLSDAFPNDINDISLSYDSSEPVEVTVGFMYDIKTIVTPTNP